MLYKQKIKIIVIGEQKLKFNFTMSKARTLLSAIRITSQIFANMSAAYLFLTIDAQSFSELFNRIILCILYAIGAILFDREVNYS